MADNTCARAVTIMKIKLTINCQTNTCNLQFKCLFLITLGHYHDISLNIIIYIELGFSTKPTMLMSIDSHLNAVVEY